MNHRTIGAAIAVIVLHVPSSQGQEANDPDRTDRETARLINDLKSSLAREKERSAEMKQRYELQLEQISDERKELLGRFDRLHEDLSGQIEALESELDASYRTTARLAKRAEELERWQVDARLTSYDEKTGRGVVPLGEKHGVRRRLRFFVGRPKTAKDRVPIIEVVRVLGPETSEVRLLPSEEYEGPVDVDDLIGADLHAPWWRAGATSKVATIGTLETTANATFENQLPGMGTFLRSQGAEVVAHIRDFDGTLRGELTDDTRLVITGDLEGRSVILDENEKQFRENTAGLIREAHRRAIPILTEAEFLHLTGGDPLPLSDSDIEVLEAEQFRELRRQLEERERSESVEDE